MDDVLESHNLNIATLVKERDHVCAMVKVLKTEKAEFEVGHARLLEDLENLDKAHKALKSEISSSSKSLDQSQGQSYNQPNKDNMESSFCEDQDVLIIESCKLVSCLQSVSNNVEQRANSRALNKFPLINWSGKTHHVKIIIGGGTDAMVCHSKNRSITNWQLEVVAPFIK